MTTPLCFVDTETTGVHPDRRVWEVAIIRRDDAGQQELTIQVTDVDLSDADPFGLKVGGFYERHCGYRPGGRGYLNREAALNDTTTYLPEAGAARHVEKWTRGAHLVGVVPSFDAGCLDPMLRRHHLLPAWHYHLVDVEAMAVGWLHRQARHAESTLDVTVPPGDLVAEATALRRQAAPPWRSDDLSRACGVEPPGDDERHTALGDAQWAMRWYDAITGGDPR